jgi:Glyoxalase/Bleomycin resistance protein/Dioxygenase superfamily
LSAGRPPLADQQFSSCSGHYYYEQLFQAHYSEVDMQNKFGQVMQFGYIVSDIEKAAIQWVNSLGAGPFYMLEGLPMDDYYYKGVKRKIELCLAFGYWGSMQIELITQVDQVESLYSDALKTAEGKLNHVATIVDDLDAVVAADGLSEQIIHHGSMPTGQKFAYLNQYLPGGLHLELIESQESSLQAFAGMQAVASGWDGLRPIRSMNTLGDDIAALKPQLS